MALWTAAALLTAHPAHSGTYERDEARDGSGDYAFAEDARTVDPADSTTGAERLRPGATYRSTLPAVGTSYFRMELDATSTTYVSTTAVPPGDSDVVTGDGIRVSVEDTAGRSCSSDTETIGAARSPHPIVAWGEREVAPTGSRCEGAGTYYVVVERVSTSSSAPDGWELELAVVTEPALTEPGASDAPKGWNSAPPQAVTGDAVRRAGGAGFSSATALGEGVWEDAIAPGQTLFYEVPVAWGTQLSATAELSGSGEPSRYTSGALDLTLHNPVRAPVEDASAGYSGRQTSATLQPLPPVEYANRHAVAERVSGMRFAGSYYLVAHLSAQVAERLGDGPFGLTLRVGIDGAARSAPEYAGEPVPGDVFTAVGSVGGWGDGSGASTADGADGAAGGAAGGDTAMTALAVGGIGTGSALLAWLAWWTARGRRDGADRGTTPA
ncbi:hypothetical protein [Streptomyces sp. NPDC088789]|uniref:hypothetical protein n=1 Tax=Streptomyces sp. NPDC088789 TaxID=3365899 RepID=UPI0038110576